MNSKLVVKNFGPIKNVELELSNVNVFIGPQSSGKSVLAKIYTIFKAPRKFLKLSDVIDDQEVLETSISEGSFKSILSEYNINSFLRHDTEIQFYSGLHDLTYKNGKINYEPKLLKEYRRLEKLNEDFNANIDTIKNSVIGFGRKLIYFRSSVRRIIGGKGYAPWSGKYIKNLTQENFIEILEIIRELEVYLSTNTSLYIPAERNFINIIKKNALNLQLNNVPIPKHILLFGAEMEKINLTEVDLGFLHKGLVYRNIDGEDVIFTDDDNKIRLSEAASGVQSAIPVILPILAHDGITSHRSFVIEEPELNLFPSAQYELIKKLESSRYEPYWDDHGSIHTYTTHSPYILSALNNLLYAHKVEAILEERYSQEATETDEHIFSARDAILKVVPTSINPDYFTAYQINNGLATSIYDKNVGLIVDNFIDYASDNINEDFEALMELVTK